MEFEFTSRPQFDDDGQREPDPQRCSACEELSREEERAWARATYGERS